jgi:hypothetical protein
MQSAGRAGCETDPHFPGIHAAKIGKKGHGMDRVRTLQGIY